MKQVVQHTSNQVSHIFMATTPRKALVYLTVHFDSRQRIVLMELVPEGTAAFLF